MRTYAYFSLNSILANVNNVTAESSSLPQSDETDPCSPKTIENHEEKKEKFLRGEPVKEFTQPVVSRLEPVLPRHDEDHGIQLTWKDVVKKLQKKLEKFVLY